MDYRVVFLLCILFTAYVLAGPAEQASRSKRDVMESMKNAWNDVVRTISDAGDAVVHVFKPTEKSTIDKIADGFKNLASAVVHVFKPTEKSTIDKIADEFKNLAS